MYDIRIDDGWVFIEQDIPPFAFSYLINGDVSGMTDEDEQECHEFEEYFGGLAQALNGPEGGRYWHVEIPEDDYPDFKGYPESEIWGIAGDYYKTNVVIDASSSGLSEDEIMKIIEDYR